MQLHNTGTDCQQPFPALHGGQHMDNHLNITVDLEIGAGSDASIAVPEILAPGIYFLRLSLPDGAQRLDKSVVERIRLAIKWKGIHMIIADL